MDSEMNEEHQHMELHDHTYEHNDSPSNGSSSSTISSLDMEDDASSSSSSLSNSNGGPLSALSELLTHLPIRRGLSKYYDGKSQSFSSLSKVKSLSDLAKKETVVVSSYCRRKMKTCRSYGNGFSFDSYKPHLLPKAIIAKKVSRS